MSSTGRARHVAADGNRSSAGRAACASAARPKPYVGRQQSGRVAVAVAPRPTGDGPTHALPTPSLWRSAPRQSCMVATPPATKGPAGYPAA
ncbi:hypothetical protein ZWY2020_012325 [Hordeum vulgare]|nr:hypothetical protein ZWY2020_012325 [Hordeum vulgare]